MARAILGRLVSIERATIIGTPMAGLLGATYSTTLPHTGFVVNVPAERLYHVRGTGRETFVPALSAQSAEPSEDVPLMAALQLLEGVESRDKLPHGSGFSIRYHGCGLSGKISKHGEHSRAGDH